MDWRSHCQLMVIIQNRWALLTTRLLQLCEFKLSTLHLELYVLSSCIWAGPACKKQLVSSR